MTPNDILRRLRYMLDYDDQKMMEIFALANTKVNRAELCNWLKPEDDKEFLELSDKNLAIFLNGLIVEKRGARDSGVPEPEESITLNAVFMKLKIAFNLQADAIIDLLASVDFRLSKHELSAFFRKPGHRQYRICKEQVMRNFLRGLQQQVRPSDK